MNKKIIIIISLFILIILIAGVFYTLRNRDNLKAYCRNEYAQQMDCKECAKKGTIFHFKYEDGCELQAQDANKECIYNDECDKNNCKYKNKDSSQGYCDEYLIDDFDTNCSRERGGILKCSYTFGQ